LGFGEGKDEEGNLPGPPDTPVARKATTVLAVITAAMVGERTEARLGRGSGQRSKAARRRRALPWASARTGEGLGTGVVLTSSPVTRWPRAPFVFATVAVGEERRKRNGLGFSGGAAGRAFDAPSCALHRSIETDGHERLGQRHSPGGKGREAEFSA